MIGDRADLAPLQGRAWDAAIDTSGYDPEQVAASAALDVGHYVFVSSCNAYPDWPDKPVDEDSPTWTEGEGYGPDKAAAERHVLPDGAVVRAGLIVGPHDNIFRLPWWVRRIAEGGEVPAPGRPGVPAAADDRRARPRRRGWCSLAEERTSGAFNGTAPVGQTTMGELLQSRRRRHRQRRDAALDPRGQARGGGRRAVDGASAVAAGAPSRHLGRRHRRRRPPGCARDRSPRRSRTSGTGCKTGGEAELDDWRSEHRPPKMSAEREAALIRLLC